MKKVVKYASLLLVGGSLLFTACKKKEDDPQPTPNPEPTCAGGSVKTKNVMIDASINNAVYDKAYSQNVTKCDGNAVIFLDLKSTKDMDKIYVTLSQDNGPSSPVYFGDAQGFAGDLNATNTDANKTFTSGSSSKGYSLDIPDGLSATKYIKVPLRVSVRNSDAATTDLYTIWITNGNGNFNATGTKTVVGPITVTLNYKAATATYVPGSNIPMGDQTATPPSYLSTNGVISSISGAALYANDGFSPEEKVTAMNAADINLVSIGADGNAYGSTASNCGLTSIPGAKPYFIGVGLRSSLGPCLSNREGTDMTMFAEYTGTTSFEAATAATLAALPSPTSDRVEVKSNSVYVFLTSDGRKGLIKTRTLTTNPDAAGRLNATVNVDVKVLTQ